MIAKVSKIKIISARTKSELHSQARRSTYMAMK